MRPHHLFVSQQVSGVFATSIMSSHSTRSASPESSASSPSSHFSGLSGASSHTEDDHLVDLRHLLVIPSNCETPAGLAKCLQVLPLSKECTGSRQYLLLAVGLADVKYDRRSERKVNDTMSVLGEALGNPSMFSNWSFNSKSFPTSSAVSWPDVNRAFFV